MAEFKVVFEIQVDADNPLEAAKQVQQWIKDEGNWQFYVQEEGKREVFSVDLNEDDEYAVLPANDYRPMIEY